MKRIARSDGEKVPHPASPGKRNISKKIEKCHEQLEKTRVLFSRGSAPIPSRPPGSRELLPYICEILFSEDL